jgi:hypothetical protein
MRDLWDEVAEMGQPTAKSETSRRLNYYRNGRQPWMRELAKQIDDGVLPPSAVFTLPRKMSLRREDR